MECTVLTLIACFSWSGLYIDGGATWEDIRYAEVEIRNNQFVDVAHSHNPLGKIAIGFQIVPSNAFVISIEASHYSSLATSSDRGVNSISVLGRWYPFR